MSVFEFSHDLQSQRSNSINVYLVFYQRCAVRMAATLSLRDNTPSSVYGSQRRHPCPDQLVGWGDLGGRKGDGEFSALGAPQASKPPFPEFALWGSLSSHLRLSQLLQWLSQLLLRPSQLSRGSPSPR